MQGGSRRGETCPCFTSFSAAFCTFSICGTIQSQRGTRRRGHERRAGERKGGGAGRNMGRGQMRRAGRAKRLSDRARVDVIRRSACLHGPTLFCGWARKPSSYHQTDGSTQAQFNGRGGGRGRQAGGRDRTEDEEERSSLHSPARTHTHGCKARMYAHICAVEDHTPNSLSRTPLCSTSSPTETATQIETPPPAGRLKLRLRAASPEPHSRTLNLSTAPTTSLASQHSALLNAYTCLILRYEALHCLCSGSRRKPSLRCENQGCRRGRKDERVGRRVKRGCK